MLLVALAAGCQSPPPLQTVSLVTKVQRTPWNSKNSTGEMLVTEHYRIYTTSKNTDLTRVLPGFMEAAHQNYLTVTGLPAADVSELYNVYMMGTRDEWALLTENVVGAQREMYLSIDAGGFFYEGVCLFWDLRYSQTYAVAVHEGLHQFLHHRLEDNLPMWLEEGLCVSVAGFQIHGMNVEFTPNKNPFRVTSLQKGILQNRWKPIRELLPLDAGDVIKNNDEAVSYYAQLWALSIFIRTHPVYGDGFRRMLADAEAGRFRQTLNMPTKVWKNLRGRRYNRTVSEPLFRRYITEDIESFEQEYASFARRLANLK